MALTVTGTGRLEAFLTKGISSVEEVADVVKEHGADMQIKAQQNSPVDTGFLKRQIFLTNSRKGNSIEAVVSGDADYDAYQEYGTRFQPGKAHIRPAYFSERKLFLDDINRVVKKR